MSVERMAEYSRSNPSPRYLELVGYYRDMHADEAGKEKLRGVNNAVVSLNVLNLQLKNGGDSRYV